MFLFVCLDPYPVMLKDYYFLWTKDLLLSVFRRLYMMQLTHCTICSTFIMRLLSFEWHLSRFFSPLELPILLWDSYQHLWSLSYYLPVAAPQVLRNKNVSRQPNVPWVTKISLFRFIKLGSIADEICIAFLIVIHCVDSKV